MKIFKAKLAIIIFTLLCTTTLCAQRYQRYPIKSNMFGIMGGVFLTSNPEMDGYNTKKNYVDGGGGFVYDYRNEVNENYSFELITSVMLASCSTSTTEEGESKLKFYWPIEARWYIGNEDFKFFVGAGIQWNFIWALKESEEYNYYGDYDLESHASAHQLSGNGSIGISLFGMSSPVHLILGAKFHFPIVNNAEGVEYSEGSKIDFSKDKTCVSATAGVAFNLGRTTTLMLNYDCPLGNNMQTSVETGDSRNFFQRRSQSLTGSLMWRF